MPSPLIKLSKELLVWLGARPATLADWTASKSGPFLAVPPFHLCLMDYDRQVWLWKKVHGCELSQ